MKSSLKVIAWVVSSLVVLLVILTVAAVVWIDRFHSPPFPLRADGAAPPGDQPGDHGPDGSRPDLGETGSAGAGNGVIGVRPPSSGGGR